MIPTLATVVIVLKIAFAVVVLVAALRVFSMDRSLRRMRSDLDTLLTRGQEEPNQRC